MSPPSDFKTDPKRDATDSIRGYVYQAYQSVLAWMELEENEILILEGSEDFDIHHGSTVTTTQVKDVSGNLTLRTQSVVDSLNNYWECCERNPGYDILLRFLTTAEAGQEQGSPFGPDQKGLEYWQRTESDHIDIEPLRVFLQKLELNPLLASFIQGATAEELREKLIIPIKWDLGNRPREALEYTIENKLKIHGLKSRINSHDSIQALPALFKKIADLLSTKGKKELRFGDFISCFDDATTVTIPRSKMDAMISGSDLQQLIALADSTQMSKLTNGPQIIGSPMPIVNGGISRTTVVSNLAKLLREQRLIFLSGSSGLGKTNLASLLSQEVGGSWGWASFRSMQPEQVKNLLARAAFEMNINRLPPFLVLDDVDLSQISLFDREFVSLVFSIVNSNGLVIITGPMPPPLSLLPKLWKSESCEVTVSYFDETEVAEMVRAHGLVDDKDVSAWARTIWFTTSGHPQLVHARVRTLRAKGWPSIELSDLTKPEDVERVRKEARDRLVQEFPSTDTRVLAYRLSLINGAFSRETALAVAGTLPPVALPGESFDALVGPWIEREGENQYRVSPLLNGAASKVLSKVDIKEVHGVIALSIIRRKSINPFEFSTAFFHAFMAKHIEALNVLISGILTEESANISHLYDAMSWFTFVALEDGQKILPEEQITDLMLRLIQYKLSISAPKSKIPLTVIERIEETINRINIPELKQCSEALAYGIILNTLEVPIPSSIVIRLLSRMIDLEEENLDIKELSGAFEKAQDDLPRIGENKTAQILFSYQGVRIGGLDDLSELVSSLDGIPSNKRDHLLMACKSDVDFASLLINQAWWKEAKSGVLDVSKALQVFDLTLKKSREWKTPEITKACLLAMSIVNDEYGHSTTLALEVLNVADKEFPDEAGFVNQRAKVFFHANRNEEALSFAHKALELPSLPNIEFVFCCRYAGIAAAKLGDWAEAEHLFSLGAKKATHSTISKTMGVGLMADAAFSFWKQKKYEESLSLFADTLDLLKTIPLNEEIRARHLHATVRHSISWINFDTQGKYPTDYTEPFPGMCSNQEPHEGIKDHHVVDISDAWEMLSITEKILKLNIGIKKRAETSTGGNKSILLDVYRRSIAFESFFEDKDFEDLIPMLIDMLEAMHHTNGLKKDEKDEWLSGGGIPKLPDGYWENSQNCATVCYFILKASVISTADNHVAPFPIKKWRADLASAGAFTADVDQFLNVLDGERPNDSIYQHAAAAIFSLRRGVLSPAELLICSFRLLNAFIDEQPLIETTLEGMLIPRWKFAINNQRFAFSMPSLACPEIERCCFDQSHKGFAKIAAVLDMASQYLNVPFSTSAKQMLNRMIEE